MSFEYNFGDKFNFFQPKEVERTTNKIKEIDLLVAKGELQDLDRLGLMMDYRISEVGNITIRVLEDYHQKLMEYLGEKKES